MRNIKEIKSELASLREAYEAKIFELESEIESVRKSRGLKPNMYRQSMLDAYEVGRSRMPVPGMGQTA